MEEQPKTESYEQMAPLASAASIASSSSFGAYQASAMSISHKIDSLVFNSASNHLSSSASASSSTPDAYQQMYMQQQQQQRLYSQYQNQSQTPPPPGGIKPQFGLNPLNGKPAGSPSPFQPSGLANQMAPVFNPASYNQHFYYQQQQQQPGYFGPGGYQQNGVPAQMPNQMPMGLPSPSPNAFNINEIIKSSATPPPPLPPPPPPPQQTDVPKVNGTSTPSKTKKPKSEKTPRKSGKTNGSSTGEDHQVNVIFFLLICGLIKTLGFVIGGFES